MGNSKGVTQEQKSNLLRAQLLELKIVSQHWSSIFISVNAMFPLMKELKRGSGFRKATEFQKR